MVSLCEKPRPALILPEIEAMKNKFLLVLILGVILLQSCTRVMSPYQAANHPRGRKCAIIR